MEKVVYCNTKEEFNFVLSHLKNHKFEPLEKYSDDPEDKTKGNCISYRDENKFSGFSRVAFYIENKQQFEIIQFEEFLKLNKINIKNTESMEKIMLDVLNKTYDNPLLRRKTVPLFMGNPGAGKSTIIREFAESKGGKMVKITLSQRMPNEVVGMVMPDPKSKTLLIYDSHELLSLVDGDILFFDEVFNGTLKQTLDAALNLLEDRTLPSGKKLADVLIVAASNPQGLINLTPQIKERFIRYDLKFNKEEFQKYLMDNYAMPNVISNNLCILINKEKFDNNEWNFTTPRSIEKAINQIGCDLKSPYDDVLIPYLSQKIKMEANYKDLDYIKGDEIEYLKILKLIIKKKNEFIMKSSKVSNKKVVAAVN